MIWFKNWVSRLNPWLPYILVTFVFQIIRGSVVDSVIFGIASLLLIADWKRLIPWELPEKPKYKAWMVVAGMVASALVLFFSPRASLADIVLLIVIAPVVVTLVYYRDHGTVPKDSPAMKRSVRAWMLVMVSMAVFEMFAFIWTSAYRNEKAFPTISFLVGPILDNNIGRTFFLVIWMAIGAYLLGLWRGKK